MSQPTPDYYQLLGVTPRATQAEIKRAYRELAKQFHPDSQTDQANHDRIVALNAAYEVLGDSQRRRLYDQFRDQLQGNQSRSPGSGNASSQPRTYATQAGATQNYAQWAAETGHQRQERAAQSQRAYQEQRQPAQNTDEAIEDWTRGVYNPVIRLVTRVVTPLKAEIEALSADPFDDELMEAFQKYLSESRRLYEEAYKAFRSMRNPSPVAGIAANLYYCLNSLSDGLDELRRFSYNYEESYLHSGKELFRIATRMKKEAQGGFKKISD
jgi:molecular chaperone DnaJ